MNGKISLVLLVSMLSLKAWSQTVPEHAFGLRFSGDILYGGSLNYQYSANEETRFEFNFGMFEGSDFGATEVQITYQWLFNLYEDFDWYAGGGGNLGFQSIRETKQNLPFGASVVGQVGIQYSLKIPLHISVDVCPELQIININGYKPTWLSLNLGVRYLLF